MKFVSSSFLFIMLLFSVQYSSRASDDLPKKQGAVVVNDNPIGVAVTYDKFFCKKNTNTHLFLGQHYDQIPQQLWDVISTSAMTVSFAFSPYLYAFIAGFVANKIQSRHHDSTVPSLLKSSVPVVRNAIFGIGTFALYRAISGIYAGMLNDADAFKEKKVNCHTRQKRTGIMPVYPQNSWLGRHFYQQILFTADHGPQLEISPLMSQGTSPDNKVPATVSEWADLYHTLTTYQIDKVVIQPEAHTLRLTFDYNHTRQRAEIHVISHDKIDFAWDIDIRAYCSTLDGNGVYSLFHKDTVKAISNAIEQAISSSSRFTVLSLNKSHVMKSQPGAAVVRLADNPGASWLVYSDLDFYTKNSGYLLIAEPEQQAPDLFDMALDIESDAIARQKSSQVIWKREDIDYLISILKILTTFSLGRAVYNNLNALSFNQDFTQEASGTIGADVPASSKELIPVKEPLDPLSFNDLSPHHLQSLVEEFQRGVHSPHSPLDDVIAPSLTLSLANPDDHGEIPPQPQSSANSQKPPTQINTLYLCQHLINQYDLLKLAQVKGDKDAQIRSEEKITRLLSTISGIEDGSLMIGSRTPVKGMPLWATPEVIKGGFATGGYVAGGEFSEYEWSLIRDLGLEARNGVLSHIGDTRRILNSVWLTDKSYIAKLDQMLESGRYRINSPEEGMHLLIRGLVKIGKKAEADQLIQLLSPYFDKIRFFPQPSESPINTGNLFSGYTVGQIRDHLEHLKSTFTSPRTNSAKRIYKLILSEELRKNADERLMLLMDTMDGEVPYLDNDLVSGGFPLQLFPDGWTEKARQNMATHKELLDKAKTNLLKVSGKKRRNDFYIAKMMPSIINKQFDKGTVSNLRRAIATINNKRGLPGSERHKHQQETRLKSITKLKIISGLFSLTEAELKPFMADRGLTEEQLDHVFNGYYTFHFNALSKKSLKLVISLYNKLDKLRSLTLDQLLEEKSITSAEELAEFSKKLIQLENPGIQDDALRALDVELRKAFRYRRSLLLTNLESQVSEDETPWGKIIREIEIESDSAGFDTTTPSSPLQDRKKKLANHLAHLSLNYFPQAILPNPLVKNLWILTKSSSITKEIAADIFQNAFSKSFVDSARIASELMSNTPYARYFGIPYEKIPSMSVELSEQDNEFTPAEFYQMVLELSGVETGPYRFTADNGRIIEWQQIITTHNLAELYGNILKLDSLNHNGKKRSINTAQWIVDEFIKVDHGIYFDYQTKLHKLHRRKNIAYALRQLIFYLSFEDKPFQMKVVEMLKGIPSKLEDLRNKHQLELQWEPPLNNVYARATYTGSVKNAVKHVKILAERMAEGLELAINGKPNPYGPLLGWSENKNDVEHDMPAHTIEPEAEASPEVIETETGTGLYSNDNEFEESLYSESL